MQRMFLGVAGFLIGTQLLLAQVPPLWNSIIGSAFTENRSYQALERICDQTGGRLVGSASNQKAMDLLMTELATVGCTARKESFTFPGWIRGNDDVQITAPLERKLRAVALGYVNSHSPIEAPVIYCAFGNEHDYDSLDVTGKVVLVTQEAPPQRAPLLRYEMIDLAAHHGALAIIFLNDHPGTLTLAGVSNFEGKPSAIPAYSITYEEGKWINRLLIAGTPVTLRISTISQSRELTTANVVTTFPGTVKLKVVIGAHFDSWDVGQGAVDNGIGSAVLLDVARLLRQYSPKNFYTVELVWFNGEELGLWGSKKYCERHRNDSIIAMINMDMTGSPTGFNCMGFDEFIPFLKDLTDRLNGFDLKAGVSSVPYTNSDHMPFLLHGIPTIAPNAHLEEPVYKYYHEMGDSFDKVSKKYLSEAAGVVTILAHELANNHDIKFKKRSETETIALLKKHKLDERLKKQKEWIFKDNEQ